MAVSARRGAPLSIEEICSTALRLMDEGGVAGLSMRKLAAELNVNPMSLYHHVDSKEALLAQICATAAERMPLPPDDGTPWQAQLRALALAYHRHAREHPAMWTYVQNHPEIVADRRMKLWEVLYRILRLAGVTEEELHRTGDVLYAFVSGFVMAEIRGHLPADREGIDRDFDTAIHLMIHGLAGFGRQAAHPD
ncbi:TetR family transcriptional regulator [Nonomuraea sp. K274]|uniref:TetR family transcriptional regulator n=1 Tax=Nonomuraea cypriaca TaxID=1187855 RepID=A0A931F4N9_9ACTN|nr:TetR/AcrR family transcriptional regulator [Nonomuraea cypriaca]MBF8191316.1 TetR family transcriptional regulator [Nonomuraea cypriaca]